MQFVEIIQKHWKNFQRSNFSAMLCLTVTSFALVRCGSDAIEVPIALTSSAVPLMNERGIQDLVEGSESAPLSGTLTIDKNDLSLTFPRKRANPKALIVNPEHTTGIYKFSSSSDLDGLMNHLVLALQSGKSDREITNQIPKEIRLVARGGVRVNLVITPKITIGAPLQWTETRACTLLDTSHPLMEDSAGYPVKSVGHETIVYNTRDIRLEFRGNFFNSANQSIGEFSTKFPMRIPSAVSKTVGGCVSY